MPPARDRPTPTTNMGRPPIYPLGQLDIGQTCILPAETDNARRCIRRNVSQYGTRHGRGFRCRLDKTATPPVMHVTRLR